MSVHKYTQALSWIRGYQDLCHEQHIRPRLQDFQLGGRQLPPDVSEYMSGFDQKPLQWADKHLRTVCVEPLLSRLDVSSRAKLEHLPVATLVTGDPNACAALPDIPDASPVIIFDYEFVTLVYQYCSLIMHLILHIANSDQKLIPEWYFKAMRNMSLFVGSHGTSGALPGRGLDESTKDAEKLKVMTGLVVEGMLTFVLAHEYGHVLCGHLDPSNFRAGLHGLRLFNKSQEQEFEADMEGVKTSGLLSMQSDPRDHPVRDPAFRASGPLVTMTFIAYLEHCYGVHEMSQTHPPTSERRRRIKDSMTDVPGLSAQVATQYDRFTERLTGSSIDSV